MSNVLFKIKRKIMTALRLLKAYGFVWLARYALSKIQVTPIKRKLHRRLTGRYSRFDLSSLDEIFDFNWRAKNQPFFSIVVPTFNTNVNSLRELVGSVHHQTYKNWELLIQDDYSTKESTLSFLEELRGLSWKVRVSRNEENIGISKTSNCAVLRSTGNWVVFLDHDDLLHSEALEEFAKVIVAEQPDYIYSDEDKISEDGHHFDRVFKPSWSPETLLDYMYVLHPVVIRKSMFLELGMYSAQYSGAQDYDLALRMIATNAKVIHIARNLYHWRASEFSAALKQSNKNWANSLAHKALETHAKAYYGEAAVVERGYYENHFRIRFDFDVWPSVSILVPTNAQRDPNSGTLLLSKLIDTLCLESYPGSVQVIVADNYNLPEEEAGALKEDGVLVLNYSYTGDFNFSKKINFMSEYATGEILVLLNDDMVIRSKDWLKSLSEWASQDKIGCVGSKLIYPDNSVQHAGVSTDYISGTRHLFYKSRFPFKPGDYWVNVFRNSTVVTGAGMAVRRETFQRLGGFEEKFAVDFNDSDFALRVAATGLRNLYNPYSVIEHLEGASLKRSNPDKNELQHFLNEWKSDFSSLEVSSHHWA
jgi:GT2 family glycosyltransferase